MILYDICKHLILHRLVSTTIYQSLPFSHLNTHLIPLLSNAPIPTQQYQPQRKREYGNHQHKRCTRQHATHKPWFVTIGVESSAYKRAALSDYIQDGDATSLAFLCGAVVHAPGYDDCDGGEEAGCGGVDAYISNHGVEGGGHV